MARRRRRGGSRFGSSMSRRSALALMGGGGALLVAGTGAYTAVEGQRPFDIGGAPDPEARFGLVPLGEVGDPVVGEDGEEVELFAVENRFGQPLHTFDIFETDQSPGGIDLTDIRVSNGQIGSGDSGYILGTLDCPGDGEPELELEIMIDARGDGVSFEGRRTVRVRCEREEFDPFDCGDVFSQGANHYEHTSFDFSGSGSAEDHVYISHDGTYDDRVEGNLTVGFVLIDADGVDEFVVRGNVGIEGAVAVRSDGDVRVDLGGNPGVEGDVCLDAGGDATLTIRGNVVSGTLKVSSGGDSTVKLRGNPTIEGDLLIDGGDLDAVGNYTVEGEIDKDWSGF